MNSPVRSDAPARVTPAAGFREAMQRYPSGVVIATTCNGVGEQRGFTASSFTSISLEPALVLLCLYHAAECHEVFSSASWFAINMLAPEHQELAARFGRRGGNKFASDHFETGLHGLPVLKSATAQLVCRMHGMHDYADHTIMIGEVHTVRLGQPADGLVRYQRRFAAIAHEVNDVG